MNLGSLRFLCKSWFEIRCERFQTFLLNTMSTCRCHKCPTPPCSGDHRPPVSLAGLSHDGTAQPHRKTGWIHSQFRNQNHTQSEAPYKTVHIERNIVQIQFVNEQHNIWALKSSICVSRGPKTVVKDFKSFCWIQCPLVDPTHARHHALVLSSSSFTCRVVSWDRHWGATTQRERQVEFHSQWETKRFDGIHTQSEAPHKTVHIEKTIVRIQFDTWILEVFDMCKSWFEIRCKRFQTFLLNTMPTYRWHNARHLHALVIIVLQFHLHGCLLGPTLRRNHTERQVEFILNEKPNRFDGINT